MSSWSLSFFLKKQKQHKITKCTDNFNFAAASYTRSSIWEFWGSWKNCWVSYSVFCFRFCPCGPPGWLCFLKVGWRPMRPRTQAGQRARFCSPLHIANSSCHTEGQWRRGGGALWKEKINWRAPPKTRHLHLTGPLFSSLHRPFSFSFSFSLPVLSIIPLSLSLSLPAKCSCCSPLDQSFFSLTDC